MRPHAQFFTIIYFLNSMVSTPSLHFRASPACLRLLTIPKSTTKCLQSDLHNHRHQEWSDDWNPYLAECIKNALQSKAMHIGKKNPGHFLPWRLILIIIMKPTTMTYVVMMSKTKSKTVLKVFLVTLTLQ